MEEPKRGLGEAIAALGRLRATGDTKHVFEITRALSSRKPPAGYARLLTPWRRPYRTLDGHVCVVPYSNQHWQLFFEEVGRPELLQDERFKGIAARTRNIDELYAELAACIATRTSADWLSTCDRLDIPASPLRRLADLESDPHLVATGFFQEVHDPQLGTLVMPRAPLKFDGSYAPAGRLPPRLGEHTREVLAEAGLPENRIEALLRSGAATQSDYSLSNPLVTS